ncbi:hypothetical protein DFP73DRAFT_535590 [Morchella snyderi]|nr:hypothetical protein DFP73DRAFT_535590 [Morchella snyderi]
MIPITTFPASALTQHINTNVRTGRRRKQPIDLSKCELLEMVQWDCRVENGQNLCWPIERLFRRCKNPATGKRVMIEVTAVETLPWKLKIAAEIDAEAAAATEAAAGGGAAV